MKRILVPTDFTEYSDYAVGVAASIAKQTEAQLVLLHVLDRPLKEEDDPYQNYYNMPNGDMLIGNGTKKLNQIISKYNLKDAKVIEEKRYDVFETILKHSERHEVDMIIIGAYGASGEGEPLIGSNTERVMRKTEIPVLIIKQKYDQFKIKDMIFASAFYGEVYDVFPKLLKVIGMFNPKIHLLKVNAPHRFQRTQDSMRLMEEFVKKFRLESYTTNIFNELTIEDGIINFSDSIDADLIGITTHGQRRLAHLFRKNITDKIVKDSVKAILSIKISQPPPTPTEMFYDQEYKNYKNPEYFEY